MKVVISVMFCIAAFLSGIACQKQQQLSPPESPKEIGIVIITPGCARYPAPTGPDADVENQEWTVPRRHLDTL